ncbi:MAG: hypothetical protein JSV65_02815 [Armatimonadota bacterium]|nr:MAG: hypothetical protein JSV65_02815 [Armatimonadota bacterium]
MTSLFTLVGIALMTAFFTWLSGYRGWIAEITFGNALSFGFLYAITYWVIWFALSFSGARPLIAWIVSIIMLLLLIKRSFAATWRRALVTWLVTVAGLAATGIVLGMTVFTRSQ